jgi:hypothetical protein
MIRYRLTCAGDHAFEGWFASAAAYDAQRAAAQVTCPACGSAEVQKALMAPAVVPARTAAAPALAATARAQAGSQAGSAAPDAASVRAGRAAGPAPGPGAPGAPADREAALAALRREIEANSDYVGMNFAAEARAIHDGTAPPRSVHGEARPDEARKLIEDGIPVAPLPFIPTRRRN